MRVDGVHTVEQVADQMRYLHDHRGPRAHAQLIGGEVSMLSPDDHAAALLEMRKNGREPMSMTNGDFDYDYLRDLALGPDGKPRLRRISFAAHFDSLMFGRRGIARAGTEDELNPYRQRFAKMFSRLRREYGVRSFLAHNMTVTPANVDQISDVIRSCRAMGYRMFSFQPAAYVGDERKWRDGYRGVSSDEVWARVEDGVGCRLPFRALQTGDERCNRTTFGFYVGNRYYPLLDDQDAADLRVRDGIIRYFGGLNAAAATPYLFAAKVVRIALAHPVVVPIALGWATRMIRTIGPWHLLRHLRIRPVTFVMHSFMDATQVASAWELLERKEMSADPALREVQERLQACFYTMGHPESGRLVPACVQHAVLDPEENRQLRKLLPLFPVDKASSV
ncbi:MAG: radical SAM domain-containing protein [Catenulispora sp.]|nr:radical SAM domain-containing protein [Catenulispora sp.]